MIMRMQCNTHHGPVEKVQIICYVERILNGDEPSVRGTQPRAVPVKTILSVNIDILPHKLPWF